MLVVDNVHHRAPSPPRSIMQAASRAPGQQAPVKIYNAVYSSVQVSPADSSSTFPPVTRSLSGLRMHGPRYSSNA